MLLLSTLDVLRYYHWKNHQNESIENSLEVTEENNDQFLGNEVASIINQTSLPFKTTSSVDVSLKTNKHHFFLFNQGENNLQLFEDSPQMEYIGLALLFLLEGDLETQAEPQLENSRQQTTGSPTHETINIPEHAASAAGLFLPPTSQETESSGERAVPDVGYFEGKIVASQVVPKEHEYSGTPRALTSERRDTEISHEVRQAPTPS